LKIVRLKGLRANTDYRFMARQ